MGYFSGRSRETKNVRALTFKPVCKYFHENDLNNSNFVLFLLNNMLHFRSQVENFKITSLSLQLRQFCKIVRHV